MSKQPLILSARPYDVHAAAAMWGLRQSGLAPSWPSSLVDGSVPPVSLYCDDSDGEGSGGGAGWKASGWLDDGAIGSIWFRRAHTPDVFPRAIDADVPFLRTEWARFLRNVYALGDAFSDRLWVNRPASANRAENKLAQLEAARRCRLRFPATLVSHDPDQIRRFVARHGRVVYKPFVPHTWEDGATGKRFGTFARLVEPTMLADDESLSLCPGIYQVYVEKKYDLRIVAIGDRFFTVRLASRSGAAFVDWRAYTFAPELHVEVCALPDRYRGKLESLLRELGLVFGCIDVAVDVDGDAHFLEVNQAGQFLFLEELAPPLPLLRAMCAMLACGRTDYSLEAAADVSYPTYAASEAHRAWWEGVRGQLEADNRSGAWLSIE